MPLVAHKLSKSKQCKPIASANFSNELYTINKNRKPTQYTAASIRTVDINKLTKTKPKGMQKGNPLTSTVPNPITFFSPLRKLRISDALPSETLKTPTRTKRQLANWHLRYNHMPFRKLSITQKRKLLPSIPLPAIPNSPKLTCTACEEGKQSKGPHPPSTHSASIGQQISSDICGPFDTQSIEGHNYFATFIDVKSRFGMIAFLKKRSDIHTHILHIFELIKAKHGRFPQYIRSDNAGEYKSLYLLQQYKERGIIHITTVPYTPEENSIAELFNRTLLNVARANFSHSHLPPQFWEAAIKDTLYKYNITIHAATNQLPYTMWHNREPQLRRMFAFGQLGTIPDLTKLSKLDSRSIPVRYLYPRDDRHVLVLNLQTATPTVT